MKRSDYIACFCFFYLPALLEMLLKDGLEVICPNCDKETGNYLNCYYCGAQVYPQRPDYYAPPQYQQPPPNYPSHQPSETPDNICPRCGANLTDGFCEYCGWNSPEAVENKTLTLSGILCHLTVTRETCIFKPKVGSPMVIVNKEISQISLAQAPVVGTGELSLLTVIGITQKSPSCIRKIQTWRKSRPTCCMPRRKRGS